ncbi:MAG: hypothetical protein JWL61_2518 [Gemmatimonadetes bacterium]|nr:hypothetical protein [Gemmatimonadota bacterium]
MSYWKAAAGLAALAGFAPLAAQTPAPASPLFSGLVFGSYNYQLPTSTNQFPNQNNNAFVVDRAYLTFRTTAGEHVSVRVTTDVYQSTETAANAYTVRAKFAYLQYDGTRQASGAQLIGRIGILQNVVIDHFENFWPRYLSQSAVERAQFFASADVGVAALYALPNKNGEVYATIVNGPGYTARERDRFKDFAMRVSLTPLATRDVSPLWKNFTITGWAYRGATASAFVNGGAGQNGAIGDALARNRAGLFTGIRDQRLVVGAELAQRMEEGEVGDNTNASPRALSSLTARLVSGIFLIRPLAFQSADGKSPFGIVTRYDRVNPTATSSGFVQPTVSSDAYHTLIAGVFADISTQSQVTLDYQEQLTSHGTSLPPNPSKGYYLHFVVNF